MSSPNRRHAPSRAAAQRRWEDVSEWPFQFIILPVLVAFAFCLVLFLGSKHGTRLAAFRTWLPSTRACKSAHCVKVVPVDSELFRQHAAQVVKLGGSASADELGVMALAQEDKLKYDFDYWLAEGEKLAGQQGKDCDVSYGLQYVEKWRKARVDWCTASGDAAAQHAAGTAPAAAGGLSAAAATAAAVGGAAGAGAAAPARASGGRRLRDSSSSGGGGGGNKTAAAAPSKQQPLKPASASQGAGGGAAAAAAAAAAASSSSISLFPYHDKDANLMFSVASNTVLDSKSFLGSLPGELPEARPGSYAAACRIGDKPAPGDEFMGGEAVRRWTKDALQTEQYDKVSAACAASNGSSSGSHGLVEHPVMLLSRYDSTNAFRTVEEVVSAFTALAVLRDPRVAKQGMQVVIADGKPDGFYLDLWASLSQPYPLRLLSQQPWQPNTCLSHVVHNTYSGASILTSMGVAKKTTCRSSVVIGASLWLRHLLAPAIQPPVRSAFGSQLQNKGVVRKSVVWISRRNFEGLAQSNLTPWQDQRRFENEGEVVLELQREVWRWNDEACIRSGLTRSFGAGHHHHHHHRRLQQLHSLRLETDAAADAALAATSTSAGAGGGGGGGGGAVGAAAAGAEGAGDGRRQRQRRRLHGGGGGSRCRPSSVFFDLRVVELNDIPFYPDHVQVLGQATVLVGAHGTGLANMMWMASGKGGVLELHHNSAGNDHYHNLAHLLGHKYVSVDSDGDRVNLTAAAEGLRKLLDVLGA